MPSAMSWPRAHRTRLDRAARKSPGQLLRHQDALRQLAGLAAPGARLLVITPYDKGAMDEIEKAIQTSDLGLNPMNDGKIIRIPIPELNEERRKDLVRHVRKTAEEFRVAIRNHRRDANDKLKQLHKDKEIDRRRSARRRSQGAAAHHRIHRKARQDPGRQRSRDNGGLIAEHRGAACR